MGVLKSGLGRERSEAVRGVGGVGGVGGGAVESRRKRATDKLDISAAVGASTGKSPATSESRVSVSVLV